MSRMKMSQHQRKTGVMLQKMQWDNPSPEKEISSIEFISDRTEAGPVLIAVSGIE